ncbi:GntR family transcriptional regulator [Limoniibacter endophyticus]|uniref:GntR family transcriptional regulator n=1 Tax=Limoniibacter endophyticus TaxID=1565040 RepID=A0A8J3DUD8_9HYPH|nr:GntR family transcriptional regulator [Limoniibacter endophyticus]GHC77871.1 GntR family transcriptional regulator [Limoniibacter endophyticus]
MVKHDILDRENLSNRAYTTLCEALVKGHYKPGDRLKIRDLAEQFGTSVTPVRDAILRLAQDEAIVFQSARNIRIPIVTKPRYLEIRAIRMRLEALAAETAARRASQEDITRLERILENNETAIRNKDGIRGADFNQAFHFEIASIADMPQLYSILQRLWLQMGPLISQVYLEGGRSMINHHYTILNALREHDPVGAGAAMITDISSGGQALLDRVSAFGQPAAAE